MRVEYKPELSTCKIIKFRVLAILQNKLFIVCLCLTLGIVLTSKIVIPATFSLLILIAGAWFGFFLWFIYDSFYAVKISLKYRSQRWFSFDSEGFEHRIDNFKSCHQWEDFCRIAEKKDHFVLVNSKNGTIIAPKNNLSETDINVIREILFVAPVEKKLLYIR